MFYVYILELFDKSIYIGYSSDLKQRIRQHLQKEVSSTKNLQPCKLICYCAFRSQEKALSFEKYLKSSSGFAFRKKRLI